MEVIKTLEPRLGTTGGKTNNIYEPHMFIPARFCPKKIEDGEDLTFPLC